MGIPPQQVRGQAHLLQQGRPPGGKFPPGAEVVEAQGLGQHLRHRPPGVQGGGGVLEHQLHLPPEGPQPGGGQGGQVLAVKEGLPLGGGEQPQQQAAQGALAAAGLPHQGQGLPLVDGDVHLGHRLEGGPLSLALHREGLGEGPALG